MWGDQKLLGKDTFLRAHTCDFERFYAFVVILYP